MLRFLGFVLGSMGLASGDREAAGLLILRALELER